MYVFIFNYHFGTKNKRRILKSLFVHVNFVNNVFKFCEV